MSKLFLMPVPARPMLRSGAALADTAGKHLQLSDSQNEQLQLGQSFASLRQITESCTAIVNTQFSMPGTKPTWFDDLNKNFHTLQSLATTWLDDYSVPILTTIPTSVNTFVPIFDASANALRAIIQRNTGILSDADAVTAKEILKRMMDKTQKIQTEVESYAKVNEKGECSGKLITWQNNMRNTYQELNTGSANIQKLSSDLAAEIEKYNTTIRTLQAEINHYNTLIGVGAGLVGSGLFIGVVGSALCFAFPVVGGIGLALGIGMVIGGGVTWGVMQSKINKANQDIQNLRNQIATDRQTIVALNTLGSAADVVLNSAQNAISNMTNFVASWATLGRSLQATYIALEQGGQEAYSALLALDLDEAEGNWNDVKEYVKKLSDVDPKVEAHSAGEQVA